ncbi:MAG: hypothetical protein JWM87_4779 [Candidatus Eremiobacteraeota bacterium]|nr:hypothetical protein [Candidatus Eremiobacteraeota bacterium]
MLMGDRSVQVRSESLAKLELAIGRFANRCGERMNAADNVIRRIDDSLLTRRRQLRRTVERLEDAIARARDDEDTGALEHRLDDAQTALQTVERHQHALDDAVERYRREARNLEHVTTGTTLAARAYLRGLIDDLAAYFAVRPDGMGGARERGAPVADCDGGVRDTRAAYDPTAFALPDGFRWVRIMEIDISELAGIRDASAFAKTPYAEMRRGFNVLRCEVLPRMNDAQNPARDDDFARHDAASGTPYEHGLQRVYEAFFGADAIRLERADDGVPFGVTNGRHRIKVAIDAGWDAVPATTGPDSR